MKRFLIVLFYFFSVSCNKSVENRHLIYPITAKGDHIDVYHGQNIPDPYHWLEDDMSAETGAWVNAQNKVTFEYLNKIPFRNRLKDRIKSLYDYERISAPFKEGDYEYFYRNTGLQDHSIVYRNRINSNAEPEVFLDPNTFSDDGTIALRGLSFTKDGSLAAYLITEGGSDWRKIVVINAQTREVIDDTLVDVKFSGLSWRGNSGFYYSSYDNPKGTSELSAKTQHHKLYYHVLGTPQSVARLVYGGEKQPNRYIGGSVTEDQNYLIISAAQNTSGNQIYVQDLTDPNSHLVQLQDDYFADCSVVDNDGSTFFL